MTEKLAEQLSALMDNECTEHERALALRRLGKENELLACWERYHLISDVLKGHMPDVLRTDFSAQLSARIAAEAPLQKGQTQRTADARISWGKTRAISWVKPVAGFAVAASVASVALLGLQTWNDSSLSDDMPLAQQTASSSPANLAGPADVPSDTARQDPVAEKLNAYLANHNELATLNGIHGVMPYVRMVNYQASR